MQNFVLESRVPHKKMTYPSITVCLGHLYLLVPIEQCEYCGRLEMIPVKRF